MVAKRLDLSENWSNLPLINHVQFGTIGSRFIVHPIIQSIVSQISQDLYKSIRFVGESEEIRKQKRLFSVAGWSSYLSQLLYECVMHGSAYLLLDFGDLELSSDPPDTVPNPIKVVTNIPNPRDYDPETNQTEVNEARYIKLDSPLNFPLGLVLQSELDRHDKLTDGLIEMVRGQGIITVGIDNLFEILTSSVPTSKLYTRLNQIKGANKGDGVLAYDLNRESVEVISKQMGREVEAIKVIENRISALTGLPSFIIWGHTDGDGYGVQSSLHLYDQRIQSQSEIYLLPVFNYLMELIGLDLYCETQDIFTESPKDKAERLAKLVDSLAAMQSIGALTSIEVRNTISSMGFELTLDPSVEVVSNPVENPATNQATGFNV